MKIYLTLILIIFLITSGCKKNNECLINFYISGQVIDANNNGIPSVEIHYVTHYGFDSVIKETTDSEGKFSYFEGSYSDLGNSYIYFRKSGYKDTITSAIGKGNGSCGDQQIIRDAIMEAQ